ncbi:MAG: YebC/PmpR family DNA-binding transcriptional regulator [Bacillota bacterium]|nr:YebC/PmpR family DNA-binding transcriptional regulator [Bacillota bacterium]
MSGHSKWATIKRKKGETDAKRGQLFTKIGREIAVAVKAGGPDPNSNSRLYDAIAKAKVNNVPNDTIQRSIKKASGEGDGANYEELVYEGYGPAGVAVIVETATDNKNRTAGEMRHLFDKYGGNLGATGCVSWMFDKKGQIIVEKGSKINEDELMMQALDAGAEDFTAEDEYYEILTTPEDFHTVRTKLEELGIEFEEADITMVPQNYVTVSEEDISKVERLIEMLEDNDDVQDVYTNME